ncbi:MAG TPA: hypothetical protein ENI27_05455 [bacterium]|nr:hypothetical protein [bacterium]
MECRYCGQDNPGQARFCLKCGKKLDKTCHNCRQILPAGAVFCFSCGQKQDVRPAHETMSEENSQSSEPFPLEPPAITAEGERSRATILFSDLSGYTAMSERLDPEEVENIMSRIKAEASKIVESNGGVVNQFIGDEVVALFGIPAAHEDDPRRAVQTALDLHRLVHRISTEMEDEIGNRLHLHSGINTGLIVTHTRDDRDGRFGLTGDVVNTGARLADLADSNELLVSPETWKLIAPYFETEVCEALSMKGKAQPIIPYRVLRESNVHTRFEASEQRGLTRYVGRERDLGILEGCYRLAGENRGQVATIVGEAGLGKSRLLHEFRSRLQLQRVNLLIGHCTATGENFSYHPFQDMFRNMFCITDEDGPQDMLEKVKRSTLSLDPFLEKHLPALLHLLSIPSDQSLPSEMAGEVVQRKVLAALKALVLAGVRKGPLVMIVEDLHWIDVNSENAILQFIGAIVTQPVMLLLSYRPYYSPKWGNPGNLTPLVPHPLAQNGTATILSSLLKVEKVPLELTALVHERTEGNPFFIEEVALSLAEEGLVSRNGGQLVLTRPATDISFPDTVQAIVRARIGRLEEGVRDTLRLAAVVGREFTHNLVARLSRTGEKVSVQLEELKTLEMILEKRFQPELEYMFKHAITQTVAYQSLLVKRRKRLHKLVGLAIEELYVDRLAEYFEMLAYHFDRGEVWDKAVEYLVKAGMKSRKNYALQVAQDYLDRAQEILDKKTPDVPWLVRYDLFFQRAQTMGDRGQWRYAFEELEAAADLARSEGSQDLRIAALFARAFSGMFGNRLGETKTILEELETIVADKPEALLGQTGLRAIISFVTKDLQSGLAAEAELDELLDITHPVSPFLMRVSFFKGVFNRFRGDFKQCSDSLEHLLPRMKEEAQAGVYLQALFMCALAMGEQGRYQDAVRLLSEGREHGLEAGDRYTTPKITNSLGWVYHELCLFDRAIEFNTLALESIQELLGPGTSNLFEIESQTRVNLGENHMMKGELQRALEYFESVYEKFQDPEYVSWRVRWQPRCLLGLAELWLARQDTAKAQSYLDEAIKHGYINGFPFKKYQVRAGRLQGNILSVRGETGRGGSRAY